jgi:hypothetical protein
VQGECNTLLENYLEEIQVCFRPHLNQRFEQRIMTLQSPGSPNRDSFGTLPWESRDKKPFGCGCCREVQRILYAKGGGFPRVRAVISLVNPELPMACPSIKGALENDLTN